MVLPRVNVTKINNTLPLSFTLPSSQTILKELCFILYIYLANCRCNFENLMEIAVCMCAVRDLLTAKKKKYIYMYITRPR